jgi:hypothetical protein
MGHQETKISLEDFTIWLRAEIKNQHDLSRSSDFTTRKTALLRFEELTQAAKVLEYFAISNPSP